MLFSSVLPLLLLNVPALGQTLNAWRQTVFAIGYDGDNVVDGNPETYGRSPGVPTQYAILLNTWDHYQGFYIQSSGPSYITDYYVQAIGPGWTYDIVGKVSGATSNFTVINFYDAEGKPEIWSHTMYLYITGIHGGNSTANSSAIVNEIYPIYRDDIIVYPPGQSASPSPTQTTLTTPTPTPTPTPTTPTPTLPNLVLNSWPSSGVRKPIPLGGSNAAALTDSDPSTGSSQALVTNLGYPGRYSLLFNGAATYAGLYILSGSANFLTDYYVEAQNMVTYESVEVCRVTGATSNFTLCPFQNEDSEPSYHTYSMWVYPTAVSGGGDAVEIKEIYPIYPGDPLVNPEDF